MQPEPSTLEQVFFFSLPKFWKNKTTTKKSVNFRYVEAFPDGEVIKHHSRQVTMPKCLGWGK